MADKRLLFVFNPHSGKGRIRLKLLEIVDIFVKSGYEVIVYPTQCAGDAAEIIKKNIDRVDLVVGSGGDGTLDEVVSGMAALKTDIPLGFIPAGSTNDFCSSLKIPRNMTEAAKCIVSGKVFPCDFGTFNERPFVYVAAFGMMTEVAYETSQAMKNALGYLAYILKAGTKISLLQKYSMKIEADDRTIEGDFIFGMVTNSLSVGGIKGITGKDVTLDDGLFEVILVRNPVTPLDFGEALTSVVLAPGIKSSSVEKFKTRHLRIETEEEVAWTLDGENGGAHRLVDIVNQQQKLHLIIPE